jgi:hypothetical protein
MKGLSKKEFQYGSVILSFAYAETPEKAMEGLIGSIRNLNELPIDIRINKPPYPIEKDQENLKKVLKELAGRKKLHSLLFIHDFTFCYYAHFASFADVQEDGVIADPPHFLNRSPVPCTALLALCLIEFLKSDINKVRKYILKCKMCKKCFITKKIDPRTKYCPTCSKKNKMPKEKLSAYDKNRRSILKKRKEV